MGKLMSAMVERPNATEKMVHHVCVVGGWRKLDTPMLASDVQCLACGSNKYTTWPVTPERGSEVVWFCGERNCVTTSKENNQKHRVTPTTIKRALPWPVLCEISGIGDRHHNVRYEEIKQPKEKLGVIMGFLKNDRPTLLMMGNPGSGKTYAAMGLCEFHTRRSSSCVFLTQKQLMDKWVTSFKDPTSQFVERVYTCELLVIDDFGTLSKPPDGFMSFFMDMINSRMQWVKRKTIITTNLKAGDLAKVCGDSLVDRLKKADMVMCNEPSRR